jgi:hypothetical protein
MEPYGGPVIAHPAADGPCALLAHRAISIPRTSGKPPGGWAEAVFTTVAIAAIDSAAIRPMIKSVVAVLVNIRKNYIEVS